VISARLFYYIHVRSLKLSLCQLTQLAARFLKHEMQL